MPKAKKDKQWWTNRIVRYGEQPANQFLAHEMNARRHPAKQREALRGSLDSVGWIAPTVVSAKTGKLLDGHARIEEALSVDEAMAIPFVEIEVSEEEERLILAALDPITGLATYDKDALSALLKEVQSDDARINDMLAELAGSVGLLLDEKTPGAGGDEYDTTPDEAQTRVEYGDLWACGEHRVLCGDSTKAEDVGRVMAGEMSQFTVTSPPYFNQRPEYATWPNYQSFNDFLDAVFSNILSVAGTPFVLCWNTGDNQADCLPMIADQTVHIHRMGLTYLEMIVWRKAGAAYSIPRSAHIRTHHYFYPALAWEPIIVFRKGDQMPKFDAEDEEYAARHHVNVWEIPQVIGSQQKKIGHPAIYPLELAERCMRIYSSSGVVVFDPFCGSGTTLIACERTNRKARVIEIEPKYVNVILSRYEAETGKAAQLLERRSLAQTAESAS